MQFYTVRLFKNDFINKSQVHFKDFIVSTREAADNLLAKWDVKQEMEAEVNHAQVYGHAEVIDQDGRNITRVLDHNAPLLGQA